VEHFSDGFHYFFHTLEKRTLKASLNEDREKEFNYIAFVLQAIVHRHCFQIIYLRNKVLSASRLNLLRNMKMKNKWFQEVSLVLIHQGKKMY